MFKVIDNYGVMHEANSFTVGDWLNHSICAKCKFWYLPGHFCYNRVSREEFVTDCAHFKEWELPELRIVRLTQSKEA